MEKKLKRLIGLIMMMVLMCFGTVFLTGCGDDYESDYDDTEYDSDYDSYDSGSDYDSYDSDSYDSGDDYNLGNYDYNDNNAVDDNEFQDAVNDYMDDNGY